MSMTLAQEPKAQSDADILQKVLTGYADHKPGLEREKARVEASGGRVEMQRCWRIISTARGTNTGLAVSRSLGDLDFKEPSMCANYPSSCPGPLIPVASQVIELSIFLLLSQ